MTLSQQQLKNYILAKMSEGAFRGLAPAEIAKKAILEFAHDVPVALGDLFGGAIMGGLTAKMNEIAGAMAERGVLTVLGELKSNLDMQYQRGAERKRRTRKA